MSGKTRAKSASRRPTNTNSFNTSNNAREAIGFWDWIGSFFWSLINWFFPVKPRVFTEEVLIRPVDFTPVRTNNPTNDFNCPMIYRINNEIFDGENGIKSWPAFRERLKLGYRNASLYITAVYITYTEPETGKRRAIYRDSSRNYLRDVEIVNYENYGGKGFAIKLYHLSYCNTYINLNDNDFQINVKQIKHIDQSSCFTGDTTIIVLKDKEEEADYEAIETKFEDLRIGNFVFTENGFKQVKYITVSNCNGKIISINIDGKIIKGTPYHPVSIKGIWMFMRDIDDAVEIDYSGNVYSIIFEDRIEDTTEDRIEDETCTGYQLAPYIFGACLGHGLTTTNTVDPVIGHDFFGNREQIIASVSKLTRDEHGRSIINGVVRNPDTGRICEFN